MQLQRNVIDGRFADVGGGDRNEGEIIQSDRPGETYVNRENFEAMQGFHAGRGRSGIGGADGKHGLDESTRTHVAFIRFDHGPQVPQREATEIVA